MTKPEANDLINAFLAFLEKKDFEICSFDGNEFINEPNIRIREDFYKTKEFQECLNTKEKSDATIKQDFS